MSKLMKIEGGQTPSRIGTDYTAANQLELMRKTIAPSLTGDELVLFGKICTRVQLDPFSRQIYAFKTRGKMVPLTGIDGFRIIAERSGEYMGQVGPMWCGDDGKWVDVWLQNTPPKAAKVGVCRKGFSEPLWGVATLRSYKGQGNTWSQMPDVMLAKCAESLALRKAFPNDLSGLYTREELDQATPDGPSTHELNREPVAPEPATMPAPKIQEAVDAEYDEDDEVSMAHKISQATSTAELEQLGKIIAAFDKAKQDTLRGVYRKRLAELRGPPEGKHSFRGGAA